MAQNRLGITGLDGLYGAIESALAVHLFLLVSINNDVNNLTIYSFFYNLSKAFSNFLKFSFLF